MIRFPGAAAVGRRTVPLAAVAATVLAVGGLTPARAASTAGSIVRNGDTIQFTATTGVANHVVLSQPETGTIRIADVAAINVVEGPCDDVSGHPEQVDCDMDSLTSNLPLRFALGDGDDYLSATAEGSVASSVYAVYVDGGTGNDTVIGSAASDQLTGGPGDDIVIGGAGNDLVRGDGPPGMGDSYDANGGNDRLYGGPGADTLRGEGGDDVLEGDQGPDVLKGDSGTDTVTYDDPAHQGTSGVRVNPNDHIAADGNVVDQVDIGQPLDNVDGYSVEIIVGTRQADTITASGSGGYLLTKSEVQGLDGDDVLTAADIGSTIDGGIGNDTLNGSSGADTLIGGAGDDTVAGGDGNDTINARDLNGADTVTCGPSSSLLDPAGDRATIDGLDTFTDSSCETVTTPMSMAVADARAVTEGPGAHATFTVMLSGGAHGSQIGFHYQTENGSADGSDYTPVSGDVHFTAGSDTATVTVPVTDDTANEPDQSFGLRISSLNQVATVSRAVGTAVVHDNADPLPVLRIGAIGPLTEGHSVQVPITLSAPSGYDVTVIMSTVPGGSRQVTIPAGHTTGLGGWILAPDDRVEGPPGPFTVLLSTPTHATVDPASANTPITVVDDDADISVGDSSAEESVGGIDFPVTLDRPVDHDLVLAYATADGSATGSDYTASSGTVTVPAGQTSATIHVPVADDAEIEADESFTLSLSWADDYPAPTEGIVRPNATGTILNDDHPTPMSNTAPPAVIGNAMFGHRLAALTGAWSVTPGSFDYQWTRDGRPIAGAVSAGYALVVADVGHLLAVVVTAHKPGFTSPRAMSAGVRVRAAAAPRLARPAAVRLAGGARVGHRLKVRGAGTPAWAPRPATIEVRWYRGNHLIRSAHGLRHRLTRADRHRRIRVLVIAHLPGHADGRVRLRSPRVR